MLVILYILCPLNPKTQHICLCVFSCDRACEPSMNSKVQTALEADVERLDTQDLQEGYRTLQEAYRTQKRTSTYDSTSSSSSDGSQCNWIRAESADPFDKHGNKSENILTYVQARSSLAISSRDQFKYLKGSKLRSEEGSGPLTVNLMIGDDENARKSQIVFGELPSGVYSKIYVFNLIGGTPKSGPFSPFRVQSRPVAPHGGYVLYCEIPLKTRIRVSIAIKRVKWLYILPEPAFRQPTLPMNPSEASIGTEAPVA
jgi:hypothetical protein